MKLNKPLAEWDFKSIFNLGLRYDWLITCEEGFMELWNSTEESINQKKLILYLIHKFLYVDSNRADEFCEKIVHQITEVWRLQPGNTIITASCDNSTPDGSQMMVQKLKNRFSFPWQELRFSNSLPKALYKIQSNDNLVICDDFVGTGLTIQRKTEYALKVIRIRGLKNVQLYIASFAAMQFSKTAITYHPFFSCEWLPKGISETLTGDNLKIATNIMEEMERILKPNISGRHLPNFGFKRSESLYNYENDNIPNNVFPVFWWKRYRDNRVRVPMFRRI